MDKLVIDNEFNLDQILIDKDMELFIKNDSKDIECTIECVDNIWVKVFDISKNVKNKITYNLESNVNLIVNKLSVNSSDELTVNINKEQSKVKVNSNIINYTDNIYKETINHNAKDGISKIINHAINVENNKFKFEVNGVIKKDSTNSTFKQDNKIINLKEGDSSILPNLIVDNNDIDASHGAYIGTFDEEIMFYMNSRGISEKDANGLLIKSLLLNMDLSKQEEEMCINIIDNI